MTVPTYGEGAAVGYGQKRRPSTAGIAAASAGVVAAGATAVSQADKLITMRSADDELRRKRLTQVKDGYKQQARAERKGFDALKGAQNADVVRTNLYDSFGNGRAGGRLILPNGKHLDSSVSADRTAAHAARDQVKQDMTHRDAKMVDSGQRMARAETKSINANRRWQSLINSRPANRGMANATRKAGRAGMAVGAAGLLGTGIVAGKKTRDKYFGKALRSDPRERRQSYQVGGAVAGGALAAGGAGVARYSTSRIKGAQAADTMARQGLVDNAARARILRDKSAQTQRAATKKHNKTAYEFHRVGAFLDDKAGNSIELHLPGDSYKTTVNRGDTQRIAILNSHHGVLGRDVGMAGRLMEDAIVNNGRHTESLKTAQESLHGFTPKAGDVTRKFGRVRGGGRMAAVLGGAGAVAGLVALERNRKGAPRYAQGSAVGRRQGVNESKATGDHYRALSLGAR